MTSQKLSERLWKKGLRIETEKWWRNSWRAIEYGHRNQPDDGTYWRIVSNGWIPVNKSVCFPAYSTDELLAVMPVAIRVETYSAVDGNGYEISFPFENAEESRHAFCSVILPEALGLMCEWLLDNGWKFDPEKKILVKEG